VILSLICWALRRVLELVLLRRRTERCKELEIVLPRHELQLLRRQVARPRFLIHDRDGKLGLCFDEVFRNEGIQVIRAPIRAPRTSACVERWARSVRRECLDWLLILNCRHLERVLRTYVEHHNGRRPHRALAQRPPLARARPARDRGAPLNLHRCDRLCGSSTSTGSRRDGGVFGTSGSLMHWGG
jgi:hypothetical protein